MKHKAYKKPAGGWGALRSTFDTIKKEKGGLKTVKALFDVNQPDGFDCPGCAWPDPSDHSKFAEYCENGVKAVAAETTSKRVLPAFFKRHSIKDLKEKDDYWLESQGRLTHPMVVKENGTHYEPINWSEVFDLIANQIRECHDPDKNIFYTSGRTSNEAAFLYQLLGRLIGTNNFPDCSNLCHESSGTALIESIGIGKGSVQLTDFIQSDLIFVIGQNPGTNHPRMLAELQKCSRKGIPIVSINPLKEKGLVSFVHPKEPITMISNDSVSIASHFVQVKVGGDLAFFIGLIKYILEQDEKTNLDSLDHAFIESHTHGFEILKKSVAESDWELITQNSGVDKNTIVEISELYLKSNKTIACWAMGITQTKFAVSTIQQIVNLLLLKGNIGKAGAGVCPVRGHSNVQGDRTMGITEKPSDSFTEKLGREFSFSPPSRHGFDAIEAIHSMSNGGINLFFGLGGNFAKACPDSTLTEESLQKCLMSVMVSTKLNRSHLVHGKTGIILPCLGRTEIDMQNNGPQFVTVEDSMSVVHASRGKNKPASNDLCSEPRIVAEIGKRLFPNNSALDWDLWMNDYCSIRKRIESVIPGFEDFSEKIKTRGGFVLRNSASNLEWNTPLKKALFITSKIIDLTPLDGQLILMTVRSHDQYNTTIYGLDDRYRGIYNGRMVLFINEFDMKKLGFEAYERVDLISAYENEEPRKVSGFQLIPYDIPVGCCCAYFPETNVLVSSKNTALKSNTPLSKYIPIYLEKSYAV